MTTLFFDKEIGKLYKWNDKEIVANVIKYGEPLTLEYKKIRIVSNKFNWIRKNRIMLIDNIRTIQTKEISADCISYYDDDVKPKKFLDGNPSKYYDIEDFDPTKYGNPVFYHTPSYQNHEISVTTRAFRIDKDEIADDVFGCLHNIFTVGSKIPNYGIVSSMAGLIVDDASKIIDDLTNGGKQITKNHILIFRNDDEDRKMYVGSYLCIPNLDDPNNLYKLLQNYRVEDDRLIRINSKNEKVEFGDTYYIIQLSNIERTDLNDFDYSSSSNDLLKSLNRSENTGIEKFSQCTKDATDLNLIKEITDLWKKDPEETDKIKSLYLHLHDKDWFKENLSHICEKILK